MNNINQNTFFVDKSVNELGVKYTPVKILQEGQKGKADNLYDVSVVVCAYNSSDEAMMFTLESIITQKNIHVEVVIADDGSRNNLHNEIIDYFRLKQFENWIMVCNESNHGTVYNLYTGLAVSNGKYVKIISPGDAISGNTTLREWVDFNENNNYRWSFSDAIYYVGNPGDQKYVAVQAHPNNIDPYLKRKKMLCRWNYTVLNDIALGATLFCERDLLIKYTKKIVNKIIYAEDNIWRMMMFDGIVGGYFAHDSILYEYGTGISTSGSDIWSERLTKDWESANCLMKNNRKLDRFQRSIVKAWEINETGRVLSKLFVKGKLKDYLMSKIRTRKTSTKVER